MLPCNSYLRCNPENQLEYSKD
ncbi:MAG: hypothetical protein H6Q23_56, partial [Bacteroidetes bacterium]|nr:hypothetical protein [Bacteroidota bacterium]